MQVNHCVEQNPEGDAAYQRALQVRALASAKEGTRYLHLKWNVHLHHGPDLPRPQLAQEILPNGPVGVAMAKAAINRGVQVAPTPTVTTPHLHLHPYD